MKPLLSKSILNCMTRTLYRRAEAVFYSVTPAEGEVEIGRITEGFTIVRERAGQQKGANVNMLLSADAGIDRSQLQAGAVVELIVGGRSTRYSIDELLPMQQLGTGYAIKLIPLQGATA